jgi:hypothetical protein
MGLFPTTSKVYQFAQALQAAFTQKIAGLDARQGFDYFPRPLRLSCYLV